MLKLYLVPLKKTKELHLVSENILNFHFLKFMLILHVNKEII
jgi:hypothetical protein